MESHMSEHRSPQANETADHTSRHQGRGTPIPPGMLTKAQAAKLLRCSMQTVQRRRHEIPHVRIDRNIYFVEAEILAWNAAEKVRVKTVKRKDTTYIRRAQSFAGDIRHLEEQLYKIVEEQQPMTVRQTFYQATVKGLVPKDIDGYNQVLARLRDMRDANYDDESKSLELPMEWIVDNSRRNEERRSFRSTKEALEWAARTYRKDFWHDHDERVLIVVEKDALAGTLYDVAQPYDIPIIVPRGYSSISYVARLAERMEGWSGQDIFLYHFADFDPSGLDARRSFEEQLRKMVPDVQFIVEHPAVNLSQIEKYDIPDAGRATKLTDTRTPGFFAQFGDGQHSYELDALPPKILPQIVGDCIKAQVPDELHAERLAAERGDRELIADLVAGGPTDFAWDPMNDREV
jgi:hypothetical protein